MENMQNMPNGKNVCSCHHHKVIPVLIILFGLTFLLESRGVISSDFAMIAWPVIIMAGGVMKLMNNSKMCKCC